MTEEKLNERCPYCDNEIKWFRDYPLMQVVSFSFIKPEEVPKVIREKRTREKLVEKQKRTLFGSKKGILAPVDVISYFDEHPDEFEYAHSDNYIYQRLPSIKNCGFLRKSREKEIIRIPNLSESVKEIVRNDSSLKKYFAPLEEIVGKTISTEDFINQFEFELEVADKFYILLGEGKVEEKFRTIRFELGANPEDMGRIHREVLYNVVLDNLATVGYIGKFKREMPSTTEE